MKTGSSNQLDMDSLKALVNQPGSKPIVVEKAAKESKTKQMSSSKILSNMIRRRKGSSFRQVIAAFIANLGTINTGMVFGFSAVAIPQLEAKDSPIQIDTNQASWIASTATITTPIGCILSGYLMDLLGRKMVLIVTQIPTIIGWLLISYANSVEMIYVGRLLVGFGSGMVGAPARVYTAETAQPHLRGMLGALASLGVSVGVLIEYALGGFMDWTMVALLSSIIPTLSLIGAFLLPESPQWLVSVGKEEQCKSTLGKLRGSSCDIDHEANVLIRFAQKNNIHKPTWSETLHNLIQPSALKPFFILTLYFLIYQFSGVNPVTFYAVEIFQYSGATMDKNVATILLGIVRVVFTVVSCVLMHRYGRRSLTFVSSIGCGITMVLLGIYMYMGLQWKAENIEPQATWIPVAALMVFTIASVIGYLVVPWVMIGEVYPTQVRGLIGGVTTCCCHFFIFVVVKTYPMLQELISRHGAFIFYGIISLLGTIFFYLCLPETKGRTLQEIEDYFSGRRKNLKSLPASQNPSFIQTPKFQSVITLK